MNGGPLDGKARMKYGFGERYAIDTERHEGALQKLGVQTGHKGKGYLKAGKWIDGNQEVQFKAEKDLAVMRKRTITKGGATKGIAHNVP